MRRVIATLIVVALAGAIVVLWPGPTTEDPLDVIATTTSGVPSTATTSPASTSTTEQATHVVETDEEAEEILRELWFGWFEGIYHQDEDRIREVVILDQQVEAASRQFGSMEFFAQPEAEHIHFSDLEVLHADQDCLVAWAVVAADFRPGSTEGLFVLRRQLGEWLLLSTWKNRNDLWEAECDSSL